MLGYEPRVSLEEGVRMMVDVRWTIFYNFYFSTIILILSFQWWKERGEREHMEMVESKKSR